MMTRLFTSFVLVCVDLLAANDVACAAEIPRLRDVFKDDFQMGAAISQEQLDGEDPRALQLAAEQFNTITAENCLKWPEVHPELDRYDFDRADKYVEFGEQNKMFIVGHTLIWHEQTPRWVFQNDRGKPLSRDVLLERMRDHIFKVVGRYKGRIHGWDVVNEAIDDNGRMRKSRWFRIIGPDYIRRAFQFAHEADPDAELYYNDYNEWYPAKRRAIVKLVGELKSKGIRIDGIGMQGHWGLDYPDLKEVEEGIMAYADATGQAMITELDIKMLPDPGARTGAEVSRHYERKKHLDPYADGLPDEMQQKLADRYAQIFRLLHEHRDQIGRVTFWGVSDGGTWLNNWPVEGRHAYPLLFDRQYQPKPAFDAVIRIAWEGN